MVFLDIGQRLYAINVPYRNNVDTTMFCIFYLLSMCMYLCIQPILGLLNLKYEASKLLRLEKECEDADLRWVVLAF